MPGIHVFLDVVIEQTWMAGTSSAKTRFALLPGHDGEKKYMPDRVLIYSRFPKAMMVRIGERVELMDAAGKPPHEVFTAEQLSGVRAMITAGGTPLGGAMMDKMPALRAIICYGTGYD